ncbi:MAG: hypothetical protein Q8L41_00765 [Anaerolineales bacterium]|nr:hypothetical protein [Anaerolineales bacterium]
MDMTKFPEYPVAFTDLQEQGKFVQSTLTADLFDPEKLNFAPMTSMTVLSGVSGAILVPNVETAPNYKDETTAPFKKEMMCGITEIDGEKYRTIQVPYFVEGIDPKKWPVITGVIYEDSGFKGTWSIGSDYFTNRMNVVPWNISDLTLATKFTNPATGENFTEAEVKRIIGEMRQGNFANTNGLVLKFDIARNSGGWYE